MDEASPWSILSYQRCPLAVDVPSQVVTFGSCAHATRSRREPSCRTDRRIGGMRCICRPDRFPKTCQIWRRVHSSRLAEHHPPDAGHRQGKADAGRGISRLTQPRPRVPERNGCAADAREPDQEAAGQGRGDVLARIRGTARLWEDANQEPGQGQEAGDGEHDERESAGRRTPVIRPVLGHRLKGESRVDFFIVRLRWADIACSRDAQQGS